MRTLVLNGGSSSFKCWFHTLSDDTVSGNAPQPTWQARIEWNQRSGLAKIRFQVKGTTTEREIMTPSAADLIRVLPEIIWCGFGVLLMLLQPYLKTRQGLTLFAMVGAAAGTLATYFGQMGSGFFGLIQFDTYSLFFHWLVGLVAFLGILPSDSYLERENLAAAQFFALILFSTADISLLASAQALLTAVIGLELCSIVAYALAGDL